MDQYQNEALIAELCFVNEIEENNSAVTSRLHFNHCKHGGAILVASYEGVPVLCMFVSLCYMKHCHLRESWKVFYK